MTTELERAARGARQAAAQAAASGQSVVGIVGRDVPALLVVAAGARPFRIAPHDEPTDEADAVMGRAVDRAAARVLAAALSGSLDFLTGIFVSRDSEASVRLFYTLQQLNRRGRFTVPVHLVDQVHQNRESTIRYNTYQLAQMWEAVERWTAVPITARSLWQAYVAVADVRGQLESARTERRANRRVGTVSLYGYRVACALPPAESLPLLQTALAEQSLAEQTRTDATSPFPVFLTGSAPLGDEVYRAVEDAGANVVAEDHDWGDPILSDRLPANIDAPKDDLLRELALGRLRGAPASASSTMAARAEATRDGIRTSGARGLLSVVRPYDEAPAWDWRRQSELAGVPAVMLRGDEAEDPDRIARAVESLRAAS
ncbi:2-hydroxyacyl-CoA dehydratase family protein [Subtercola sp. YIM 133946]|uniref:2-hydroxyacyl-CoA dehydratase family protein n=1 Tax=Subtercola sp. YIM 133946 TaxID=3118909 RepID=UPI002F95929F